jgi:hypothetical protein
MFSIEPATARNDLSVAAIGFVVGLLLAWLANGAAYFTSTSQQQLVQFYRDQRYELFYARNFPPSEPESEEAQKKREAEDAKLERKLRGFAEVFRYAGIVLSFLSFFAFVVGSFYSAAAILLEKTP